MRLIVILLSLPFVRICQDNEMSNNWFVIHVILILSFCFIRLDPVCAQDSRSVYQFNETLDLIEFVEQASQHFAEKGSIALLDFGIPDSKWFKESRFIFIYDLEGYCAFHPVHKEFVGQNVLHLKDMNGKPIIQLIIDIVSDENKGEGWLHYLWADWGGYTPSWKSAYVKRVTAPDGKTYALGSGTYDIRTEKKFMIDIVNSAARLLENKGESAYNTLIDKANIYYFRDIYIFVINMKGEAIVDPVFPGRQNRDLIDFRDMIGNYVVVDMIERLSEADSAMVVYVWPKPGQSNPSKKVAYVRKVNVNGEDMMVGSSMYIVEPIWRKF